MMGYKLCSMQRDIMQMLKNNVLALSYMKIKVAKDKINKKVTEHYIQYDVILIIVIIYGKLFLFIKIFMCIHT